MGKGSTPRPFEVSQDKFASNWDAIFKGKKDVLQPETKDTSGQTQETTASQAGCEVLRDSQGAANSDSSQTP